MSKLKRVFAKGRKAVRTIRRAVPPGTMTILAEEGVGAGALGVSCYAEGYLGASKFEVSGVDVRGPLGLLGMVAGGYLARRGTKHARLLISGSRGVAHSVLAGAAVRAGQRMAAQGASASTAEASKLLADGKVQGDDVLEGFLRDIHLQDRGLEPAGRAR
jgi:hypothetical protein